MDRHLPYQPNLAFTDDNGKLIILHNSGFYSCCSIRLRKIINWYNEYKKLPIVDSSKQWGMYKDKEEDISLKFFTPSDILDKEYTTYIDFSKDIIEDQFSSYSKINFNDVSFFIKKYYTPSKEVKTIEKELVNKYHIDTNKTIAVCYRGTDKKREVNIPSYQEMFDKIKTIQHKYPNHKLLVQSDEQEFIDASKIEFPNLIHFQESRKVSSNHRAVQFYFPQGEKVHHAQVFLAIMQILSKCDRVILNSGNVGMWICLFRNSTKGVSQYLKPKLSPTNKDLWV